MTLEKFEELKMEPRRLLIPIFTKDEKKKKTDPIERVICVNEMVRKLLHNKYLDNDDYDDIAIIAYKKYNSQTKEENKNINNVIYTCYKDYVETRNSHYQKRDSFGYIPKHITNYEEVVNDLKEYLTPKEYELMYLYYVCGYTLEELAVRYKSYAMKINRWIDKILNKIKNIKNEAEKGKDMYDENYDDDDLVEQWFKDNDVWDRVEQPKTTWKQNKSVFPQVSHNELKCAIESLGLDARTQSEIFFLYNGDVNYFGWESKYLEHKDLIEDIISEVVRLRKVRAEDKVRGEK